VTAPEGFVLTLEDYPAYPGGTVLRLTRDGRSRGWLISDQMIEDTPVLNAFVERCAAEFDEEPLDDPDGGTR
jgi:hypothetical protein